MKPKKPTTAEKKRFLAIRDEDIDTSDIPELDEKFWKNAKLVVPENKKLISLRLDPDVLAWFRSKGPGWQTAINAILKTYIRAKEK